MKLPTLESPCRWLSLLALSATLVFAAACSNSDEMEEEGSADPIQEPADKNPGNQGGDNNPDPGTQNPGNNQNPGSGGGNGNGGGTGNGNGGGNGNGQTPAACNPIEQTGCSGATSKCGLTGSGRYGCQLPGTAKQGEACEDKVPTDDTKKVTGDSCESGLVCIEGKCQRFCSPDKGANACGGEQACTFSFTFGNESFKLCEPKSDDCDPVAQTGCTEPLACFVAGQGAKCYKPGTKADGESCQYTNDCQKGSACFSSGNGPLVCSPTCTLPPAQGEPAPANPKVCPTGKTCIKADGTNHGLCG